MRQAVRELVPEGRLRYRGGDLALSPGPNRPGRCPQPATPRAGAGRGARPAAPASSSTGSPARTPSPPETGLPRGEPVRHLERVPLADDERVGLESTYVAVARRGPEVRHRQLTCGYTVIDGVRIGRS